MHRKLLWARTTQVAEHDWLGQHVARRHAHVPLRQMATRVGICAGARAGVCTGERDAAGSSESPMAAWEMLAFGPASLGTPLCGGRVEYAQRRAGARWRFHIGVSNLVAAYRKTV